MGTSRGVGEFADKMGKLAKSVVDQNKPGVVAAATVYKTSLIAEGKRDSGGDGVLSNFGKNGAKLSAGYDLKSTGGKAQAIVKPRPMGPWKVLEYGAKPHPIIPGLTRRQQRAMALFSFMAGGRGAVRSPAWLVATGTIVAAVVVGNGHCSSPVRSATSASRVRRG